ncbi:MAG TPA: alpha/beta hydrolase [Thermoanaerobaculia bacterium]|nr:alpha/beta hydrolase [Thermoanaerobaculia bacterium]
MPKKSAIGRTVVLSSLRAGLAAASTLSPQLAGAGAARLFLSTRRHPMPEWERAQLASARRSRLASEWGPLAVWTWGPEDAPAMVLQHGWEGRGSQLGAFVPPLLAAGYRVVALDGPGHGDSPGRSSSLVALGQALRLLGGSLGPLAGVVAHSAGTVAAIHALSRGLVADRLVAIAPGVDLEAYAREFARMFGLSAAVSRSMRQRIERRIGVSWEELDPRRAPAHVRIPLLVIHDRTDREAPYAGGEALARAWGARLITTEGLGHTRILRNEQVVAQTTEFLSVPKATAEVLVLATEYASAAR